MNYISSPQQTRLYKLSVILRLSYKRKLTKT